MGKSSGRQVRSYSSAFYRQFLVESPASHVRPNAPDKPVSPSWEKFQTTPASVARRPLDMENVSTVRSGVFVMRKPEGFIIFIFPFSVWRGRQSKRTSWLFSPSREKENDTCIGARRRLRRGDAKIMGGCRLIGFSQGLEVCAFAFGLLNFNWCSRFTFCFSRLPFGSTPFRLHFARIIYIIPNILFNIILQIFHLLYHYRYLNQYIITNISFNISLQIFYSIYHYE